MHLASCKYESVSGLPSPPFALQVVTYVSRGDGDWYPYDVSCNIIRSFDHTRIHTDVYNGQDDEWTFLLYLSPLGSNDFGETAFYTENHDDTELVYQASRATKLHLNDSCTACFNQVAIHACIGSTWLYCPMKQDATGPL